MQIDYDVVFKVTEDAGYDLTEEQINQIVDAYYEEYEDEDEDEYEDEYEDEEYYDEIILRITSELFGEAV